MPKCGVCGAEVGKGLFVHLRKEHPEKWAEMEKNRVAAFRASNFGRPRKHAKRLPEQATDTDEVPLVPKEEDGHEQRNGHSRDSVGSAVRVQFVQRTVQVDARILLFYNLCRQRFPDYDASEGEWLLDIVTRYFVEHARDIGLDATTILDEVRRDLGYSEARQ